MDLELPETPLTTVLAGDFSFDQFNRSIDSQTLQQAQTIVDDVRVNKELSLRKLAIRFGDRQENQPLWIQKNELLKAKNRIDSSNRALLERVAKRIEDFASAQLSSLSSLTTAVPGGTAGHTIEPIQRVGCYAPAGRFPLPSTVLMTAVTARVAGCNHITLATPNPNDIMLAAASVAGCDQVLAVGGAQAVAAMAYGTESSPRCDLICGPGNRWVTAAKKIVNGDVGIDMLAGPSELVAIVDETSHPHIVAADLLAQAEHDVDARPFLVATSQSVIDEINQQLRIQLADLPTRQTAIEALQNSAAILTNSIEEAIRIANELAPEHLELHCSNPESVARQIRHAGCLFIGNQSAEVFGDYGVGPNHTLPTAGTARWSAGLNVFTFVRIRTWLNINSPSNEIIDDTTRLAELEGLTAHARASKIRQIN